MDAKAELISRIMGVKQKCAEHDLKDLQELVTIHTEVFDRALKSHEVEPFKCVAYELHGVINNTLTELKKKEPSQPYTSNIEQLLQMSGMTVFLRSRSILQCSIGSIPFNFVLEDPNIAAAELQKLSSAIEKKVSAFEKMYERIYASIRLEVQPDPDIKEKIHFPRGNLIIANNAHPPRYYVFKFSPILCNHGNIHLGYTLVSERARSMRHAIQEYADTKLIGTIIVARNAWKYPLFGTSLPISMKKYGERSGYACKEQSMS